MPWHYRDYVHLGLLLCCVPLQLFLSNYSENTNSKHVMEIVNEIRNIREKWFTAKSWKNTWMNFLSWFVINILGIQKEVVDESPAVEVLEFRKKHGLRGKSNKVHVTRPPELWFRVGQVVEHIYGGYKGVIVEWEFNPEKSTMPMYRILVDEEEISTTNDYSGIADVEQDQLYLLKNTQITNRFLKNYFSAYDGSQYIPQPWLQQLYPRD